MGITAAETVKQNINSWQPLFYEELPAVSDLMH
jgi:hypothetical protein